MRPETNPLAVASEGAALEALLGENYALAVIDGVTDALGLFGLSTKDNDDITKWNRTLPKRIAERTGCLLYTSPSPRDS